MSRPISLFEGFSSDDSRKEYEKGLVEEDRSRSRRACLNIPQVAAVDCQL
jgi:hypothetical protein